MTERDLPTIQWIELNTTEFVKWDYYDFKRVQQKLLL